MTTSWDYIVIGAGIMGAYSAYTLAKNGFTVLMIEQSSAPNPRGSSNGKTRQIYKALDNPHRASMMEEIYELWWQLEKETTLKILNLKPGLLLVGKSDASLSQFRDYLTTHKPKYEYEFMTGEDVSKRYPIFSFDNKYCALLDKSGGVIMASNSLTALYTEFKRRDGVIHENEVLVHVRPISDTEVSVKTDKGMYTAHGLVITAGGWTAKILENLGMKLPLTTTREDVWYYKQLNDNKKTDFPCFFMYAATHQLFSLPELDQPGLAKVVFHGGTAVDPDSFRLSSTEPDEKNIELMADFLRLHMPSLSTVPMIAEKGYATYTPDQNFIIDRHPKFENIVIGAGFSGRGFQFAPVIGKLLAELVTKQKPSYDLEPYSLKRFTAK